MHVLIVRTIYTDFSLELDFLRENLACTLHTRVEPMLEQDELKHE